MKKKIVTLFIDKRIKHNRNKLHFKCKSKKQLIFFTIYYKFVSLTKKHYECFTVNTK